MKEDSLTDEESQPVAVKIERSANYGRTMQDGSRTPPVFLNISMEDQDKNRKMVSVRNTHQHTKSMKGLDRPQ